jgi:antitoxin VapB
MKTARLFNNGRSQAVRLPKEFRFDGNDVYVKKLDNIVMLFPMEDPWIPLINSLDKFSDDFMVERNQPKTDKRASIK